MALRQTPTQSVPIGQWATPISHSRPSPLTPDDIAANTFPGADRVFQRRLALGRRIARGLQSVVVERDFEIATTFIAALIIQRDRMDQLRRVVRHRAAIGLALFEPIIERIVRPADETTVIEVACLRLGTIERVAIISAVMRARRPLRMLQR
jgi:hypothetical protein